MSKIVLIADLHYNRTYHEAYDKERDIGRLLEQIIAEEPKAIIALGDIVDMKHYEQNRSFISYPDGLATQVPFVNMVRHTNLPWFWLLGNHDDPKIFYGIAQAASNLAMRATNVDAINDGTATDDQKPLTFGNVVFWFGSFDMNWPEQQKAEELRKIFKFKAKYSAKGSKNVLLLHDSIIRRGEGIGYSKELIADIAKNMNLTIAGHEHEFKYLDKAKKVVCAPAAIPTGVKKNSNPLRQYKFKDHELEIIQDWEEPFGYLVLDDTTFSLEFKPFHPSAGTIQVEYDITGKGLDEVQDDWRYILSELKEAIVEGGNLAMVVVMPIITGQMDRLRTLTLKNELSVIVPNADGIFISDPKFEIKDVETPTIEKDIAIIDITKDGVLARTIKQTPAIVTMLKERSIDLEELDVRQIIGIIMEALPELSSNRSQKDFVIALLSALTESFNEKFDIDLDDTKIANVVNKAAKKKER